MDDDDDDTNDDDDDANDDNDASLNNREWQKLTLIGRPIFTSKTLRS